MNHLRLIKSMSRVLLYTVSFCLFLCGFAEFTLAQRTIIRPVPDLSNRKAIVSNVGEVNSSVGYIGERARFRIYYRNTSRLAADIRIIDLLEPGLKEIDVQAPGKYDSVRQSIVWDFKRVRPGGGGYVEFAGILAKTGSIGNVSQIQFSQAGRMPPIKPTYGAEMSIIGPAALIRQNLRRPLAIETNKVVLKVYGSPKLGWIPFEKDAKEGALPKPAMKDTTTTGAMINFDIPGVFVRQVENSKTAYHRFALPGQASLTDLGKPELPVVGQAVEVPQGVDFSIEVVKARLVSLDHYRVYPAQHEFVDARPGDKYTTWLPSKFELDRVSYLKNREYPGALGTIRTQDIGVIRGHRVVLLKVNPIQYNPVTHETKAYAQIEVRVKYSKPAQVNAVPKRLYSRSFEKYLKNLVINYQDPKRFDRDIDSPGGGSPKEGSGCDYLILTRSTFYTANDANNPVNRLADWKRRKGLKVKIVDLANVTNGTTYDGIRQYLKNAYDTWTFVPAYVLLIGDAEHIPVRYLTPHPSHNNTLVGTDLYYSTLDGNDDFPDIYVGRLPVDTLAEATAAVDKIINYEQQPPNNANFYTNVMFSALFEDESGYPSDGTEDGREDRPWIENVEDIRNFLLGQGYQADRIYTTSSGWPGDPMSDQPGNYENNNALPAALQPPGFGWNGTPNDVSNGINAGRFLVTYRDHGGRADWSSTGFDTGDADGLANGNLTPVIFSIACQTGWFDNETDDAALGTANNDECLCEHFIRHNNGGAVVVIGATRNSWTGKNDFMMFGLHKAIWPNYVPNPPITGYPAIPSMDSNQLLQIGQILTFGKMYMARCYNPDTNRTITFEMYHVFGDPEMPIWTAAPLQMDVTHPADIGSAGDQHFVVKVINHNTKAALGMARVVITRGNAITAVAETDPAGIARFKLTGPASGDLDITVTSLGYRPYMGKITVSAGGATLNRLEPDNGIENQTLHVGGINFDNNENVDISFDGAVLQTKAASAGSFGQTTQPDVDIKVPSPHDLGPVNVITKGQTSNRYGVDVFQVRSQNPVDLYTYDQWDSSTWALYSGTDNPTWDNPSIRLYDSANNLVASNNLKAGFTYTIKCDVHNDTDFPANHARVTFKWANFGLGQPPEVWTLIDMAEINVPAHSTVPAEVKWTTPGTGHLCVLAEIYHIEDINTANNQGQENCHVGPTSSPAKVPFTIWNPTGDAAMVYLDLRQVPTPEQQGAGRLWGSLIIHPDPQLLQRGEKRDAAVVIDPDPAGDIKPGQEVEYSLTGFVNGKIIGGANFRIKKK